MTNKNENEKQSNSTESKDSSDDPKNDELFSDLYPERRGQKVKRNWFRTIVGLEGKETIMKLKCEANVYNCVKDSPLVKLMLGALKSSGCEIDIRRHISCEICDETVTGGYDPDLNQIVVCQNTARSKGMVQGVLSHEMVHMFDFCRHKLDLTNIDHLACTEIRAANLCHCSFLSAWTQGLASPFNIKEAHQDCVKDKAMKSIIAVRKVPASEAQEAVIRVFDKCYDDLEPVGRRIRRNSLDMKRAYTEASLYGYLE